MPKENKKPVNKKREGPWTLTEWEKSGKRPRYVLEKNRFLRKEDRWEKAGDPFHTIVRLFDEDVEALIKLFKAED